MGFQILRIKKLKSRMSVRRSLTHSHREQETLNADSSKCQFNGILIGAENANSVLRDFEQLLPEKTRKGLVLCIEYLVTASPESMIEMTRELQDDYFADATTWLKNRHGEKNVFHVGIHRDEKTPHMFAYVMPFDPKGNMNAHYFLGGRKILSEMQTDFHQKVSQNYGLNRGIKGSKARHQRLQRYYAQLNQPDPLITVTAADVTPKKIGLFKQESYDAVAKRLSSHFQRKLKPVFSKAKTAQGDRERAKEMVETAEIISKKNEILSRKADYWEEQNIIFHYDLAPEDLEQLLLIADKMRIERQQKNYLAQIEANPDQLLEINAMYADKGVRLYALKNQSASASEATRTTSLVENLQDGNGRRMR